MSDISADAPVAQTDEPSDAGDAHLPARRVRVLGDERDLAVVVGEADAHEPVVGDALVVPEVREVALVDGLGGERAVERDDERLVLGPDGPDEEASPSGDVQRPT